MSVRQMLHLLQLKIISVWQMLKIIYVWQMLHFLQLKNMSVRQMLHLKQTYCLCHLRLHSLVDVD